MIFVTGGTGFLGRHLLPALCREGHQVRLLTRSPEQYPWLIEYPNLDIIRGDLADLDILKAGVQGCQYVIHAGGYFRFWGDEDAFMRTNAQGTENMMCAAQEANVERIIHISSVAVIGQPDPTNEIDETYPPSPVDPYQRSKLEGEQIALGYFNDYQLPVIVLRPGAFYGPLGTYAFNRLFFKDPMNGIIMQLNGGRYINFPVYIEDVVQGILKALEHGQLGEVYHICGEWISHKDAFDIIIEEAHIWYPRLRIPGWMGITTSRFLELLATMTGREPFYPLNLQSYVYNNWRVSNEKACRELLFEPTAFRDGARRTIAWYRAGEPELIDETKC
ncbi:MAG: NAD-dependent epimerase/dehydratase family protein [Aggregatilineales bacterium]